MKLTPYSKYKESGVDWIGKVPEHWEIQSLKSILAERIEKNDPIKTVDILSLTIDRGVIPYSERGGGGNKSKEDISGYKLAYPNDIVLNSMNVVVGAVGLSKYFGAVSPVYYMLYPRKKEDKVEYFSNIFQSETFQRSLLGLGNGILMKESNSSNKLNTIRMRIPMGKLNTQVLPYPGKFEQGEIIKFLDRETGKLDNLISKQEHLIDLLKQKRQAIISHAVIRGLNPDAKMKDSGVEWLGLVPEHWCISKNKHYFNFSKGLSITKDDLSEIGVPCINYGEIHSKFGFEFNPDANLLKCVSDDYIKNYSGCLLEYGDFVFADTSEDYEGSGNFTYLTGNKPVFAGYHTVIARMKFKLNPRFFAYFFQSNAHRNQIRTSVNGVKVFSVTQNILKNAFISIPSISEQNDIVLYLNIQTNKIDTLIEKAKRSIDLAKEHRTSLISAAVTGKIDVREAA